MGGVYGWCMWCGVCDVVYMCGVMYVGGVCGWCMWCGVYGWCMCVMYMGGVCV